MNEQQFAQLPLGVQLKDEATLHNFYPGENVNLLAQLFAVAQGGGESFLYLCGSQGVGKTHLLQGLCQQASHHHLTSLYLPLRETLERDPNEVFEGLEHLRVVAIDDLEVVAGNAMWEEVIMRCYNRMQAQGEGHLVISANASWQQIDFHLEDLRSRLAWGLTFRIQPLSDGALRQALKRCAKRRGMALNDEVCDFLLKRCPRDLGHLTRLLQELDEVSLSLQRKITIPLIKEVFAL